MKIKKAELIKLARRLLPRFGYEREERPMFVIERGTATIRGNWLCASSNDLTSLLDWANWQVRFQISWQCCKPGTLLRLNPKLLRRFS